MRPLKQTLNKTPLSNCTGSPASAAPEAGLRSLPACFLLFFVLCRIITLTGKILYNFLVFFPFGILKPQTVASFLFPSPRGGRAPRAPQRGCFSVREGTQPPSTPRPAPGSHRAGPGAPVPSPGPGEQVPGPGPAAGRSGRGGPGSADSMRFSLQSQSPADAVCPANPPGRGGRA